MLRTAEGIFRDGRIELKETPEHVREARVLVTFLPEEQSNAKAPATSTDIPAPPETRAQDQIESHLESGQGEGTRRVQNCYDQLMDDPWDHNDQGLSLETLPTPAQRAQALQSWVDSLPPAPTVPLDEFDREKLYP